MTTKIPCAKCERVRYSEVLKCIHVPHELCEKFDKALLFYYGEPINNDLCTHICTDEDECDKVCIAKQYGTDTHYLFLFEEKKVYIHKFNNNKYTFDYIAMSWSEEKPFSLKAWLKQKYNKIFGRDENLYDYHILQNG